MKHRNAGTLLSPDIFTAGAAINFLFLEGARLYKFLSYYPPGPIQAVDVFLRVSVSESHGPRAQALRDLDAVPFGRAFSLWSAGHGAYEHWLRSVMTLNAKYIRLAVSHRSVPEESFPGLIFRHLYRGRDGRNGPPCCSPQLFALGSLSAATALELLGFWRSP